MVKEFSKINRYIEWLKIWHLGPRKWSTCIKNNYFGRKYSDMVITSKNIFTKHSDYNGSKQCIHGKNMW